MDGTYRTSGIVLKREPYREDDLRVTVYTPAYGKLTLIARGAKKAKAKLAAHLEPFCLTEIMAVRGKQYDYVGSAISRNGFFSFKKDLERIEAAGRALKIFNQLIKEGQNDAAIFNLLNDFLDEFNRPDPKINSELFARLFIFKLFVLLGYRPELYYCLNCKKRITPGNGSKFDLAKSGLICSNCPAGRYALTLTDNSIKVLRMAAENSLDKLTKLNPEEKLEQELTDLIDKFLHYHAN